MSATDGQNGEGQQVSHDEQVGHDQQTSGARARPRPVLEVQDLAIDAGDLRLLDEVTLRIMPGERVGLIGESGSGKSITSLAIMGLLPRGLAASGSVRLAGVEHDLVRVGEDAMSSVRGREVAMVFQEPMTALNPTMRVGDQVAEAMTIHGRNRDEARARALELLEAVQLPEPASTLRAYPHQLSGGQRQRVVLAIALANDPRLLICDEPTTALDVTVQAQVLDLVVRGVEARESALLFITHDLAVVATVCERVAVMYGGRIVETGPVAEVFRRPRHRYTQGLLAASDLAVDPATGRLRTIAGSVPAAGQGPAGCVFRNRCWKATDVCATTPAWTAVDEGRGYACHHPATSEMFV